MNLKTLVWLATITYTIMIGGTLLAYRYYVVFPELATAALDVRRQNLQAIYATYINEKKEVALFNRDWANWDEMYGFLLGTNPSFISNNLDDNGYLPAQIDALAIINLEGKTVYAVEKGIEPETNTITLSELTSDLNIDKLLSTDYQSGIIRLNNKMAYFVSHHIRNTQETLPYTGALIFIRQFKEDFISRINTISGLKTHFVTLGTPNEANQNLPTFNKLKINTFQDDYLFNILLNNNSIIGQVEISFPKLNLAPIDKTTIVSITAILILPILITILTYLFILRPIIDIQKKMQVMKKTGKLFHLTQKSHLNEIDGFLHSFNGLVNKVHLYQQKLLDDSNTDGLTGIYNRKFFDDTYDKMWRASTRTKLPLSIIMLDIDYFKKYNDHYGHLQGDTALKEVATTLHNVIRRADDVLARYGGEEFVIISHTDNQQQLADMLNMILESIRALKIQHQDSKVSNILTVSCGACIIEKNGPWMKDHKLAALKISDEALYTAKESGRDQFCIRAYNEADNSKT